MERMTRMRNEVVNYRVCVRGKCSYGMDRYVLKWLGHAECMSEEQISGKVYASAVKGRRVVNSVSWVKPSGPFNQFFS